MLNNGYKVRAAAPIFDMDARYAAVGVNASMPNRGSVGGTFTTAPAVPTLIGSTLTRPLQSVDGGLLALISPTTLIGANVDEGSAASTAIGFTYTIDGVACTAFTANPNGWAALSLPAPSATNNANLNAASGAGVVVAPWWDDTMTATTVGYVKTELLGVTPNRVRVIEWKCYGSYSGTPTNNDTLTFQACLYETSNTLEFRYADVVSTGAPGRAYSASCGVRGDCSVTTTGHWWDFFGVSGTPPGTTGTMTSLACAPTGQRWPGDPGNSSGLGAYNIKLVPSTAPNGPTKGVTSVGSACILHATVLHHLLLPAYAYGAAMFCLVVNEVTTDAFAAVLDIGTEATRRFLLLRHNGVNGQNVGVHIKGNVGVCEKNSTPVYSVLISESGSADFAQAAASEIMVYVSNATMSLAQNTSSENTGTFGTLTGTIGGYNDGSATGPFIGKTCRVLVFNRIPSVAERTALQVQMRLAHGVV